MPKLRKGTIVPSQAESAEINRGIAADADTLDTSRMKMRPAKDVLGADTFGALVTLQKRPRGRPTGSVSPNSKVRLTMRFDPDLVDAMRASGPGWQTRANDMLRKAFVKGGARR